MRALKPAQPVGAPPPAAKPSPAVARSAPPAPHADVRVYVEDRLSAILARAVNGRSPHALLQRVGETKLAHEPIESGATAEAREQWIAALQELRATRRSLKATWEEELKKQAGTDEGISQRTIMSDYPRALTMDRDVISALRKTAPFKGGGATLMLERVASEDDTEQYIVSARSGGEPVASVVLGTAAYRKGPPAPGGRATFRRNAKEYVADNRGIPTRRYAYVEKNVFQVMELLAGNSMTGRYQMLHTALGINADIYEASEKLGADVTGGAFARGQKLTLEQLAVLHQWKGSGQDQRGLSLTSSPRQDAVYSNRGGSFRSAGGARIKIDLFKVPTGVVLLNHYGSGGVKEALGDVNPALNTGATYSFANSVLKNRELYLERLDPSWISSLTLHEETGDKTATKSGAELLQTVASRLGYNDYASGFTAGSLNQRAPDGASPMFILGQGVGREYRAGYQAGTLRFPVAQPPPEPRGGPRGKTRSRPWKPPEHRGPSFGTLKTEAHDEPDRHLIYWIGWAHGGWNRPQATTLRAALR